MGRDSSTQFPHPRQREISGACLVEAFCPLETIRLKGFLLCRCYHCHPYFSLDDGLWRPLSPAKALSPPGHLQALLQAKHKSWCLCRMHGPQGTPFLAGSPLQPSPRESCRPQPKVGTRQRPHLGLGRWGFLCPSLQGAVAQRRGGGGVGGGGHCFPVTPAPLSPSPSWLEMR